MYFLRSRTTLDSLKSVFNVFRRKSSLGAPVLFQLFRKCTFDGTCRQPVENEHVVPQYCKLNSSCNHLNPSCKTSKNCKTHLPHREVAQFQNLLIRNNWKSARDYCEKKKIDEKKISQDLMEEFSFTIRSEMDTNVLRQKAVIFLLRVQARYVVEDFIILRSWKISLDL